MIRGKVRATTKWYVRKTEFTPKLMNDTDFGPFISYEEAHRRLNEISITHKEPITIDENGRHVINKENCLYWIYGWVTVEHER